jgi:hypothetical protein
MAAGVRTTAYFFSLPRRRKMMKKRAQQCSQNYQVCTCTEEKLVGEWRMGVETDCG